MAYEQSKAMDELKRIIYKQNEVIETLRKSTIQNPDAVINSQVSINLLRENEKLAKDSKRYKRERDELLKASKVLEDCVYVFKQERDQLQREILLLKNEVEIEKSQNYRKKQSTVYLARTSISSEENYPPENETKNKRYKYQAAINPTCMSCNKLEKKLIEEKAKVLTLDDQVAQLNSKMKKNVSLYKNNLEQVGKDIQNLCEDFVNQSAQVGTLKDSLAKLNLQE